MGCICSTTRRWLQLSLLALALTISGITLAPSQTPTPPTTEPTVEEAKEQQAVVKFLDLLIKRPVTGTALERVLGHHVQRGTIADLLELLNQSAQRASSDDESGRHYFLIGLLQLERGNDAQAVKALDKAQSLLQENALAAFHYGQALQLVGNTDAAASAFESAIKRKPPRNDYLNIARELGRLYQRGGKTEDALRIWNELEKNFPGDDRVQSRIAATLVEEGELNGARERYEAMAKTAKAENDRISYALEAARLRGQLGQKDQALKEFDALIAKLRPGSYLVDEARRRIESIFLASGDYAGLTAYYQAWLKDHPDDLNVILRTARTLSLQGRSAEAIAQFESAIARAPTDEAVRLACIDAYIAANRFSDAASQFETLIKLNPNNRDYLVRYGQVVSSDTKKPEAERAQAAAGIWKRLIEAKPKDAAVHAQVADLLRGVKLNDEAIASYRAAIALAPAEPQYKEYLGEYLYQLKRTDEAIAVWRSLAEGEHRNLENLVRLAEVFHQFEQPTEALEVMRQACELKPTALHRVRYVQWLSEVKEFDKAYEQLDLARQIADTDEDRASVLAAAIKTYQASGKLPEQIAKATAEAQAKPADSQLWRQLAILHEANNNIAEALIAIEKAIAADPRSIETLEVAARMMESAGRVTDAIGYRKQLVELDRRFRSAHLQRLAMLQMTAGQMDVAIVTGKEVLASSGGAVDAFKFYADLCGRLGRTEEQLDTLRRCVRLNPRSRQALDWLATQLAADFKTDQAIELVWKQFELAENMEQKRNVVARLSELYLRNNRLDQLISRLEIRGREANDRRLAIDLAATAYQHVGDLGLARDMLESLLREGGRDTLLLERLVNLALQAGELDRALELQRELVRSAPSEATSSRLAALLVDVGAIDEAQRLWLTSVDVRSNPAPLLRAVDQLFVGGEYKSAIDLVSKVLETQPTNWELMTRRMILAALADEWSIAIKDAQTITSLDRPDEEVSATNRQRQASRAQASRPNSSIAINALRGSVTNPAMLTGPIEWRRIQNIGPLATLFDSRMAGRTATLPAPSDLGEAKLMANFLIWKRADQTIESEPILAELKDAAMSNQATSQDVWKWFAVETFKAQSRQSSFEQPGEPESWSGSWRLLEVEPSSARSLISNYFRYRQQIANNGSMGLRPLTAERLHWLEKQTQLPTMQPPVTNWPLIYVTELQIAGKDEEAKRFLKDKSNWSKAKGPEGFQLLLKIAKLSNDDELWEAIEQVTSDGKDSTVLATPEANSAARLLSLFTNQERVTEKLSTARETDIYRGRVMQLVDRMIEQYALRPAQPNALALATIGRQRESFRMVDGGYQKTVIDFPPAGIGPVDFYVIVLQQTLEQLNAHAGPWLEHRTQADDSIDPRVRMERLTAAAYLQQWLSNTDAARELLERALAIAVQHVPHEESTLRLLLADLLLRQDRKSEALAMIEQLTVVDQNTMVVREFAVARLASSLGNKERAIQAARRLIGVRLPAETQLELAGLLTSLNMNELAGDVVRRLRGRSGSSNTDLQTLLKHFQSQNDKEGAIQVARELLQRTAPAPRRSGGLTTREQALRGDAIQTLATNGQLQPLIESTKQRLERAPDSQRIRAELAELYQATGQVQELDRLLNQGTNQKNESTLALEAEARQLVRAAKWKEACDAHLKIIRRNPKSITSNTFSQMERPFLQAKRLGELADVFMEVGIERFDSSRIIELCAKLIRNDQNMDKSRELFQKLFNGPLAGSAAVDHLNHLSRELRRLIDDEAALLQIMDILIKVSATYSPVDSWSNVFWGNSFEAGRQTNCLTYLLRLVADKPEMAQAMERRLREEIAKRAEWREGKVWLGLLMARLERYDEAQSLLESLVTNPPHDVQESMWLVCSELDRHAPLDKLTEQLYEQALKDLPIAAKGSDASFDVFPVSLTARVCEYHLQRGNKARAKELVMQAFQKLVKNKDSARRTRADFEAYGLVYGITAMMKLLTRVDAHVEAMQLANVVSRTELSTSGSYDRAVQINFETLLDEIKSELKRQGGDGLLAAMIDAQTQDDHAVSLDIRIDQLPFTRDTIKSVWHESLAELAREPEQAQALSKLLDQLTQIKTARPTDPSVCTAQALVASYLGSYELLNQIVTDGLPQTQTGASKSAKLKGRQVQNDPFGTPSFEPEPVVVDTNTPSQFLAIAYLRWSELQQAQQATLDGSGAQASNAQALSAQAWLTAHVKELPPETRMQLIAALGKRALTATTSKPQGASPGSRIEIQTANAFWRLALDANINPGVPPAMLLDLAIAAARENMLELSLSSATAAARQVDESFKRTEVENSPVPATPKPAGSLGSLLGVPQTVMGNVQSDSAVAELPAARVIELDQLWIDQKVDPQLAIAPLKALVALDGPLLRPLPAEVTRLQVGQWKLESGIDRLARRAHACGQTETLVAKLMRVDNQAGGKQAGDKQGSNKAETVESLVKRDPERAMIVALVWLRDGRSDKAKEVLQAFNQAGLNEISIQFTLQTLLAAMDDDACRTVAAELGLAWVAASKTNGSEPSSTSINLAFAIARTALNHKLDKKLSDSATSLYLELSQVENARYRDGQNTQRIVQLDRVAELYTESGAIEEALTHLGKRQSAFYQGYDRDEDESGARLLGVLYANDDRQVAYRQLADWTFQGDVNLNSITAIVKRPTLPEWIPESSRGAAPKLAPFVNENLPLASNFHTLALLAEQSQQQADLLARYQAAHANKRLGAAVGLAITLATWKRPVTAELLTELSAHLASIRPDVAATQPRLWAPLAELQLALILNANRETLADREQLKWVQATLDEVSRHGVGVGRHFITPWLSRTMYQQGWAPWNGWQPAGGLKSWMSGTTDSSHDVDLGLPSPLWLTDGQGQLAHLCGHGSDWLWWRYPLEGNFVFEFETPAGDKREMEFYAAGLRFAASTTNVDVRQDDAGDWLSFQTTDAKWNAWNKHSLALSDDQLSYSINGSVIYKEARLPGPIFLALRAFGVRNAFSRNIQFSGQPKIARSVPLITGDHLRGWSGSFYGQTLLKNNLNQTVRENGSQSFRAGVTARERVELSWLVDNQEIVNGGRQYTGPDKQSLLQYSRPMSVGEKLEYEFYYEPGQVEVHPCLGRTAFLLSPEGAARHCLTEPDSPWKLASDNRFPLQGTGPLPLRPGDWNKVTLVTQADKISLSVNDKLAVELPWTYDESTSMFGLFHLQGQTRVRVRNVTLTGSWPEAFPEVFDGR